MKESFEEARPRQRRAGLADQIGVQPAGIMPQSSIRNNSGPKDFYGWEEPKGRSWGTPSNRATHDSGKI
jgi:hypothetical protein